MGKTRRDKKLGYRGTQEMAILEFSRRWNEQIMDHYFRPNDGKLILIASLLYQGIEILADCGLKAGSRLVGVPQIHEEIYGNINKENSQKYQKKEKKTSL